MGFVGQLAQRLPSQRVRTFCRDFIDTELRGFPRAAVKYRQSQLSPSLDMVLSYYRASHPQVRYLQIGAFDGVSGDPIYPLIEKHSLQGILVEPQRDAFERLVANYARFGNSRFVFIHGAVGASDGTAVLYRVRPSETGPSWLPELASFNRDVILKHASVVPDIESLIESEEVKCITFKTLFETREIPRVDLLQIDAEGYDAEILRLFDVPSRKPAIIHFEHKHLALADHEQAIGTLVDAGYKFTLAGENTLAYLHTE